MKSKKTSWGQVSEWYHGIVQTTGHYYHKHIILPGVLRLLHLKNTDTLLDVGCGQGILARTIPAAVRYEGLDVSEELIRHAVRLDSNPLHTYAVQDVSLPFKTAHSFSHAAIILALQNMEKPLAVLSQIGSRLQSNGILVIVCNHPCFRIPRQSSWGIDEKNKMEYRRINRYLSPLSIPINAHPGQGSSSPITWSFHQPLGAYSRMLHDAGFSIDIIEEWASDRESNGKNARMENIARREFPLFLAIKAVRKNTVSS